MAPLRHHEVIRLCPLTRVKRSCGGHRRRTESDPTAVIGWIGIPQRSSLLPYRAVLPLGWKHGRARQASPRFRTIQDLPKDLSAALRQAEGEEDRPQGSVACQRSREVAIRLKREGRKSPWST